jgi:uncharacterized protein
MVAGMSFEALSPTVITGWLECEHSLALRLRRSSAPQAFGPFADLVRDKGRTHELAVRDRYQRQGLTVLDVEGKGDESFETWAESSKELLETTDADVIYQMPFVHQGIKGIADFLIRVEPEEGFSCWEPVDAKLARSEGKPGHLLQLCFYAEAVEALTGNQPKLMHLELGSGATESYRFEEFGPYWRRMKLELSRATDEGAPPIDSEPEPCSFCQFCDFQKVCEDQWRSEDSLVFVADLMRADRQVLSEAGIISLEQLASATASVDGIPDERFERVRHQAQLQKAHRDDPGAEVPFTHVAPGDDPAWGHGYSHLPSIDDGDVFFDLEGHPLFTAESGIFFLFGLLYQQRGEWIYEARWAHSLEEQERQAVELVAFFEQRRSEFPGMHVYHYNHTERSALNTMVKDTAASVAFAHLVATGLFVDLRTVVKNAYQIGIETYGLKDLERVTGFERTGEIHAGSGAVLLYEDYRTTGDDGLLSSIALYNDNDVRSTRQLRDWLLLHRPGDLAWRDAQFDEYETRHDLDELEFRLLEFDRDTDQHLLGNLIGYWKRERSAQLTPRREKVRKPVADLLDDDEAITGLQVVERDEPSVDEDAGVVRHKATFTFPDQAVSDRQSTKGFSVFIGGLEGETNFAYVPSLDLDNRTATVSWKSPIGEPDIVPISIIEDDWVGPGAKVDALLEAARTLLADPTSLPDLTKEILRRAKPRFIEGGGPRDGIFTDDKDEMVTWAPELDRSIVAVQGPPGTGKTFRGARMVRKIILEGKRVGVTGPSYAAFGNFLAAVVKHFNEEGDIEALRAAQKTRSGDDRPLEEYVKYATSSKTVANAKYNLVAGTSWFFCSKEIAENPVDVLIVDEAGQVSLADAAAMSLLAGNVILLGDPLQLDQVSNAVHPEGSGSSSLEYMLDGAQTIAPDRGVFIEQTWRMHPKVCHFISSQIYEDRLHSHESCARQEVADHGAGLRWLEATHEGNSTRSEEEATLIVGKIKELLGQDWTNQRGETRPLEQSDFMVVAPFNDQKDLIRKILGEDPATADIARSVGTVDKFQGQEAPVVFFSMTTSDSEGLKRGADFLFSKSRLNVAVSRARCLAYLVCTDALLGTKASTVDGMRLIGTLNSFVEEAERE